MRGVLGRQVVPGGAGSGASGLSIVLRYFSLKEKILTQSTEWLPIEQDLYYELKLLSELME